MTTFAILACGNCVYYAMWHKFPPTASWVLVVPIWFLVLSSVRTWIQTSLFAIPKIYIALPLVLAVFFFAPGMIGPPLGFWIPICCIVGTCAGIRKHWNTPLARLLVTLSVFTAVSLVAFGAYDYHQYNDMPAAEKEKYLPVWETLEGSGNEPGK